MRLVEDLLGYVVGKVLAELPAEFERLGRDVAALGELTRRPVRPAQPQRGGGRPCASWAIRRTRMPRSTGRARRSCRGLESRPFFLTDYPKGSRGFYDRENPQRPGYLRNFDLIAAEGYGELCSGSEREHDYAAIIARMRETGENPAKYGWYLDMVRDGHPGQRRLRHRRGAADPLRRRPGFGLAGQRVSEGSRCGVAMSPLRASAFPEAAVRDRARLGAAAAFADSAGVRARAVRRRARPTGTPTGWRSCAWCHRCSCRTGWPS